MGSPLVSVVMASYNYGRFIGQAVQSVVTQTFPDWELLIIDDGSTDNTAEVIAPFLGNRKIRYLPQENQGQPRAKNQGIRLARGEFIAFLDADDAWLPHKLEKQLPLFVNQPRVGVTYTGLRLMDANGKPGKVCPCRRLRGDVFREALYKTIPPFSSTIVRKSVFADTGFFNEQIPLAIDFELWIRVAMRYQFDFLDEPLLLYRIGHANLSRRYRERREIVINHILPHVLDNCGARARLTPAEVSETYSRLFMEMGDNDLPAHPWSAFRYYARAVAAAPWLGKGWRKLTRACLPSPLVSTLKRLSQENNR